jgi:hypothetical protein
MPLFSLRSPLIVIGQIVFEKNDLWFVGQGIGKANGVSDPRANVQSETPFALPIP